MTSPSPDLGQQQMSHHHARASPSLLGLPTEVRRLIFELLFSSVSIFPRNADKQTQRPEADSSPAHHQNARLSSISPITSILQTCLTCHLEATPLFWSHATFCIYNIENHRILTDAKLMPTTNRIRHLVIHNSILSEWTPTLLTLLFPSLLQLSIVHIITVIGHQNLVRVEQNRHSFEGDKGNNSDEAPGMTLLYSLIASQPSEEKCNQLLSHYQACQGKYLLHLHFLLRCGHVGQNAVPGAFVGVGRRHEHDDCVINYAFRV